MIIINESKLQYKANDGGITRRVTDHFVKRSVIFETNGNERRMDIPNVDLGITATEKEIIEYIKSNIEKSMETNSELKELRKEIEQNKIEQANAEMEMMMLITSVAGGVE